MEFKECTKCEKSLSLDNFYNRKASTDGLTFRCKKCAKKHNKNLYEKNPLKYIKRAERWQSENKEKHLENCKKYKLKTRAKE